MFRVVVFSKCRSCYEGRCWVKEHIRLFSEGDPNQDASYHVSTNRKSLWVLRGLESVGRARTVEDTQMIEFSDDAMMGRVKALFNVMSGSWVGRSTFMESAKIMADMIKDDADREKFLSGVLELLGVSENEVKKYGAETVFGNIWAARKLGLEGARYGKAGTGRASGKLL